MAICSQITSPYFPLFKPEVVDQVNLHEEYFKSGMAKIIKNFNFRLVGLEDVKNRIKKMAMFMLLQLIRQRMELESIGVRFSAHMCFTGAAGTGKTLVARRYASVLRKLGVISKGHLVVARRDDLVGQYIGHTAPKTKAVLRKAEGGVLFLDNANDLYKPNNPRDYGSEVIELLLEHMEKLRNPFVIVFAGYKTPMDAFFLRNPGLAARVLCHIDFPNYTMIELVLIAFLTCKNKQY